MKYNCFDPVQSALDFRHNFSFLGGLSAKLLASEASSFYHKELVAGIRVFSKNTVLTSDSLIGDNLVYCFATNSTVFLYCIVLVLLITEFW